MKKIITKFLAVTCTGLLGLTAQLSMADDSGTLNISGRLTDTTCKVYANGQLGSVAGVVLPAVNIKQFDKPGARAGLTKLEFMITACSKNATAKVYFLPGANTNLSGRLDTNVPYIDLQFTNSIKQVVNLNAGVVGQNLNVTPAPVSTATNTSTLIEYWVEYYAVGTPVSYVGPINTSVDYQIVYE